MSDINKQNTPNQMRILLKRMRVGDSNWQTESKETSKKDLNVRDMLKITRKLNEDVNERTKTENKKTVFDQSMEERKLLNFFRDLNVNIKFIELEIYDSLIFWGGTVDGIIQFIYKVTPDESTSGVEFNYLDDFTPDNPENQEVIKKLETYYDIFYKYWRNNMVQQ